MKNKKDNIKKKEKKEIVENFNLDVTIVTLKQQSEVLKKIVTIINQSNSKKNENEQI